jgi:hypothetical protein
MMRAIFWDMTPCTVKKIYLRSSELLMNSCKETRHGIPQESTLDMLESKQIFFIIITRDRTLTNTRSSSTIKKEKARRNSTTRNKKLNKGKQEDKKIHHQNTKITKQQQE